MMASVNFTGGRVFRQRRFAQGIMSAATPSPGPGHFVLLNSHCLILRIMGGIIFPQWGKLNHQYKHL